MSGIVNYTGDYGLFRQGVVFDPTGGFLTTGLMAASLGTTAFGTMEAAKGTIAAGNNAVALGNFQQAEDTQQADTSTAMGQRQMLEEEHKGQLTESTLQARAAMSGAAATSPSTLNVAGRIAGRSLYSGLMDLSMGEDQAAGLTNMGDAAQYQGQLTKEASQYSAMGTIAGGVGSMFSTLSRYNSPYGGFGGSYAGLAGMPNTANIMPSSYGYG